MTVRCRALGMHDQKEGRKDLLGGKELRSTAEPDSHLCLSATRPTSVRAWLLAGVIHVSVTWAHFTIPSWLAWVRGHTSARMPISHLPNESSVDAKAGCQTLSRALEQETFQALAFTQFRYIVFI